MVMLLSFSIVQFPEMRSRKEMNFTQTAVIKLFGFLMQMIKSKIRPTIMEV